MAEELRRVVSFLPQHEEIVLREGMYITARRSLLLCCLSTKEKEQHILLRKWLCVKEKTQKGALHSLWQRCLASVCHTDKKRWGIWQRFYRFGPSSREGRMCGGGGGAKPPQTKKNWEDIWAWTQHPCNHIWTLSWTTRQICQLCRHWTLRNHLDSERVSSSLLGMEVVLSFAGILWWERDKEPRSKIVVRNLVRLWSQRLKHFWGPDSNLICSSVRPELKRTGEKWLRP